MLNKLKIMIGILVKILIIHIIKKILIYIIKKWVQNKIQKQVNIYTVVFILFLCNMIIYNFIDLIKWKAKVNKIEEEAKANDKIFETFYIEYFGTKIFLKHYQTIKECELDNIEIILDESDTVINELKLNNAHKNMFLKKIYQLRKQRQEFNDKLKNIGIKDFGIKLMNKGIFSENSFYTITQGKYDNLIKLMGKSNQFFVKKLCDSFDNKKEEGNNQNEGQKEGETCNF